jgi:hypothetical protein
MDYNIGEEEGILEKAKAALAPVKPYLIYIVAALVVIVAAYYFFFLAPKPGSVIVTVSELDGGALDSAQVYFTDASGKSVGTTQLTTAGGTAVFDGLPTQTQMFISVEAGSGYNIASTPVLLTEGANTIIVQVERKNGIEITATDIPQSFASACRDRFYLEVTNFGDDPFSAELVSEGDTDFSRYFAVQGSSRVIGPNESANFSVFAELPDTSGSDSGVALSGAIRVKGTTKKVEIGGSVGKPLQLETSESEISYTPGSDKARRITVRNTGTVTLENFATRLVLDGNLQSACGSDGKSCFNIEVLGDSKNGRNAIAPGDKNYILLRITPPSLPDTESYFGSLQITGTCLNSPGISIPITVNLKTNQ